jgi:hypothetical protein
VPVNTRLAARSQPLRVSMGGYTHQALSPPAEEDQQRHRALDTSPHPLLNPLLCRLSACAQSSADCERQNECPLNLIVAYLLVVIPDFAPLVDELVVQLCALRTTRPLVVAKEEMVPEPPVNESLYRMTVH